MALTVDTLDEYIEFLLGAGLLQRSDTGYRVGTTRLHLGSDSPFIGQDHSHWRMRVIYDVHNRQSTHFSTVYSLSRKDVEAVKELLLGLVQ
jgi:hypothetical protein